MYLLLLTLFLSNLILISSSAVEELQAEKDRLFKAEMETMTGHDIVLNEKEQKVNNIFMGYKLKELESGFKNPKTFAYNVHFFDYKDKIRGTKLFELIKKMPKGALLHAHDTGVLSPDYMLSLTYWDNLYVCFNNDKVDFRFASTDPNTSSKYPCETRWQLMKDVRNSSGNVIKFDESLRKRFGMVCDDALIRYNDINDAWGTFQSIFIDTGNLVNFKPAWEKYFYDTLKALREDNVMFFEIRSVLPSLYDLEGNVYDSIATAESYKKVTDQFKADYPDFFGAKLIYAPLRCVSPETVREYLKIAREINRRLPGFIAGFDLVGQEDLGQPLKAFLPELIEAKQELNLFLHAGETNWYGLSTDNNLYDAIALGAKRIGHGYSIVKHPRLMEEIKARKIALEVNVISNVILRLVTDVRNHPLATWLAKDLPVVIASDDPGLWEAEILSHDYYVVFVAVSSRYADLRMLKKLALNSLYYSTYPDKDKIVKEFENRWSQFIDSVLNDVR